MAATITWTSAPGFRQRGAFGLRRACARSVGAWGGVAVMVRRCGSGLREFVSRHQAAQLADRDGFDLPDALAGDIEMLGRLSQRAADVVIQPVPESQDAALAVIEFFQQGIDALMLQEMADVLLGRGDRLIL